MKLLAARNSCFVESGSKSRGPNVLQNVRSSEANDFLNRRQFDLVGVLHIVGETLPTDRVNDDALLDGCFEVVGIEAGVVEAVDVLLKAWQVALEILDHFLEQRFFPGGYFVGFLGHFELELADALEESILLVQSFEQFQSDSLSDNFLC